jgi:hypothetical protein
MRGLRPFVIASTLWLATSRHAGAADNPADSSTRWVRSVVLQDTDAVVLSTRLPFVFRTTSADSRCQGSVRTRKDLRAWVACVGRRDDFREIKGYLDSEVTDIRSGWAHAGDGDPKADQIALKIGGRKGWSRWRTVFVSHLWRAFQFRLFDQSGSGGLKIGALIVDERAEHD